jgi:CRP/FNR family transcriptional regulator, cyclic AMP receptor protein
MPMDSSPDSAPASERPSIDDLRRLALFGGLSDDALRLLADTLFRIHAAPGDVIFRHGDDARELYVVLNGEVELCGCTKSGAEHRIATLTPGGSFGEICVLDVQRRATTARVLAPTRLLVLSSKDLDALYRHDVKAYTMFILNMCRELCRRLRQASTNLAEATEQVQNLSAKRD